MAMNTPSEEDSIVFDGEQMVNGLHLQSSRTSERLNQIDRVRANGIGDHVALPQLVVCGDQSVGKSSVLEGISGIPFPRQDGLCTRFATEIVLRHDLNEQRTTATILPHVSRTDEEKLRLSAFRQDVLDLADLSHIIEQAAKQMGICSGSAFADAPAFSSDVLRLEVVGNTGLHLTLVDLPGLISVSDNGDDKLIEDLVDSYLENSRTIVLAVIPASSDAETQKIIQRARHFDNDGVRTVGVITKPDLINDGTESRVVRLARNASPTKLNLGFFLLKNPTPIDLEKGMTIPERRRAELQFFSSGLWRKHGLDPSRVGIDNLREFLQDLLDRHIERELPKVRKDVEQLLNEVNGELIHLGAERTSPSRIRLYLTRISTDFQNLVKSGVEGVYGGRYSFFEVRGNSHRRLRAAVHMENERYSSHMREDGQKRKIVPAENLENTMREEDQLLVTKEQMATWVKEVL